MSRCKTYSNLISVGLKSNEKTLPILHVLVAVYHHIACVIANSDLRALRSF